MTPDWTAAACRTAEPRFFDPATAPESKPSRAARVAAAQAVCARCPIKQACLQVALQRGDSGVWGGVLLDLGAPFAQEDRTVQPCGTEAARQRHRYHREPKCVECETAHEQRIAQRARDRAEREHPCGTPAAARRHQRDGESACEACRLAVRVDRAERRRAERKAA